VLHQRIVDDDELITRTDSQIMFMPNPIASSIPTTSRPRVEAGRQGERRWWRVGADRVELAPAGATWQARVHRAGWEGLPLDLDGQFADEPEAVAWCQRMADVLARDADDDLDDEDGPGDA
jgi:hypothetical protein